MADGTKVAVDPHAPAGDPKRVIVGIKVKFELNAKNGLRRVMFGLEKTTEGTLEKWKITFELFERDKKSDAYTDPLVNLEVDVDTALNTQAESASGGLTPGQAGHVLGPASADAKGTKTGDVDPADAKDTIQTTLKKQ